MNKTSKHVCRLFKKSMSLVLAFSIMISVCVISGITLNVSAATSNGQRIYINTNQNSTWKSIPQLKVRMTNASGAKLSDEISSSGDGVFMATAPSGATRVEISAAPFTLPDTVVPNGKNRIVYKSPYGANTHVHYYGSPTEVDTEWPGEKMTQIGTTEYYYIDIDDSYTMLNFNNGGSGEGNQTSDLTINFSYSDDYAYYNGTNWANPLIKIIDLADITAGVDTEYYLNADGTFSKSKYLSNVAADMQNVTYKTVYVVNKKWTGIDTLYATFDYSENYRGTVTLTATTASNGERVFRGTIPADASIKFHPNKDNNVGASSTTKYPAGSSYDGTGYSDNTATYKITTNYEDWCKLSEINDVNFDAVVASRFHESDNILGVDATYFDYISDVEMNSGYLTNQENYNSDYNGRWFPFSNFNRYISGIASSKSNWQYPLYFGNLYKEGNQFGYSNEVSGLSKYYDGDYRYAINNSNGLGNMYQSLQGLVYDKLDSNGNLQVADGVVAPYFDADALSTATYNNNRVAKVFKSSFPFRSSTNGDVTTYTFDSTDAKDNVYFTWDGTTPKYVNYGGGWQYQVWDANYAFGGSTNGKGIFPFNNSNGADGTVNTWHQTVDGVNYSRGGNNELDFGFGIRLDIDFRVPKYGTLDGTTNGTPVEFNYTGDDDLWVFIGEEENGADAELVLDLGGDHKKATGSIDFSTMTATANDVYANFGNSSSSSEVAVPSDEFWVKRSGNYTDSYYCVYTWGNWTGYVHPYNKDTAATDGYYKFKQSDFGGNTMGIFCKWENVNDGKLSGDLTLTYGTILNEDGTTYSGGASGSTNLGAQTKRFGQEYGVDLGMSDSDGSYRNLDPNKVYHMTVFYMERGLSESNFSVGFTMTPANNELEVTKELDTGDVIPAISQELKETEEFDFEINDNNSSTSADAPFILKDEQSKDFINVFSTGSQINVKENLTNTALKYETSWELYDGELGTLIDPGTGVDSQFKLEDLQDTNSLIDLDLKYTNKIKTNDLEIVKKVYEEDGTTEYDTAQRFTFQMLLDLDGDGSKYQPKAYPLEYTAGDETLQMASDGSFTLGKDEVITVINIPVGATYTLKELTAKGFKPNTITFESGTTTDFDGTCTAVMDETVGAKIEVSNIIAPIVAVVEVNKTLDGSAYSGEMFTYTITGLGSMPTNYTEYGALVNSISTEGSTEVITKPDDEGKIQFTNAVNLVEPGYYRYIVTESFATSVTDAQKADFTMDSSTILVEVDNSGDSPIAKYAKVASSEIPENPTLNDYVTIFNSQNFTESVTNATFNNATSKAQITVNKKNQADAPIEDTVFALIKISDEIYKAGTAGQGENNLITGEVLEQIIDSNTNMIKGTTNADGNVEFNNLLIYEDGSGQFVNNNGAIEWSSTTDNYLNSTPNYQAYCIFEYSPANGYNPTNKVQYVTFPVQGKYSVTFDYVDGLIVNPDTSGNGVKGFVVGGMAIILVSALLAGSYVLYDRTERKKRMARNG